MTVAQFKNELEAFLKALQEHYKLWGKSLNQFSGRVGSNADRLQEQSSALSRKLGRIHPYIVLFDRNWMMHQPATGINWDALDAVVSPDEVRMVKESSYRNVVGKLNQIIGALETRDPNKELYPHGGSATAKAATQEIKPPEPVQVPASPAPVDDDGPTTVEPFTLEKISVRGLMSAVGNLSLTAALTLIGLLVTVITITAAIVRWTDSRTIDPLRDSVVVQRDLRDSLVAKERTIQSLRRQRDSLVARARRSSP
jgi:hypothetical protein